MRIQADSLDDEPVRGELRLLLLLVALCPIWLLMWAGYFSHIYWLALTAWRSVSPIRRWCPPRDDIAVRRPSTYLSSRKSNILD
jgi:hypothetical protein